MNGVVLFGYYGSGNLGDETNLAELVALIKQLNHSLTITVISASPRKTAMDLKVNSVGKFHWIQIITIFLRNDLLIGGGGSLFQDRTSLRSLLYYSVIIFLARCFRIPVFLYGQGIGPIRSRLAKIIAGWALSKVKLVTVRDRLSIIALAELNVKKPEIHLTAEPLLLMKSVDLMAVRQYWAEFPSNKQSKLGLIIQKDAILNSKFWVRVLDFLAWAQDVELYLIPVNPEDHQFQTELAEGFGMRVLPCTQKWEEILMAFGGLDLVVSTRLHGLVAAVVQGTPCFGLAADPKIDGFCKQLGVEHMILSSKINPLLLSNRILDYLHNPLNNRRPWLSQLALWKARAKENQVILAKFIAGEL